MVKFTGAIIILLLGLRVWKKSQPSHGVLPVLECCAPVLWVLVLEAAEYCYPLVENLDLDAHPLLHGVSTWLFFATTSSLLILAVGMSLRRVDSRESKPLLLGLLWMALGMATMFCVIRPFVVSN